MAKSLGLTRNVISLDNFINPDTGRARKLNSPRSLESCLRQGIDPSELTPLSVDVFIKEEEELTGLKDVAVCKWEHYEERRNEKLSLARQERDLIIGFLEEAAKTGVVSPQAKKFMKLAGAADDGKELSDAEKLAIAAADAVNSSMLEEEKRRIEQLKQRQQKEIEQMMEFEVSVAKMQAEQTRLQELDAEKQIARKKARENKKKAAIEKRRQRDLARAAKEEEEERMQAEQARKDYIFEQRRKKMQLQQEKELKRQAKEAEEARIQAKLQRAADLKAIQDAQATMIAQKMAEMRASEKRRKDRTEAENAARLAASRAKKLEAEQRIKKALAMNEEQEWKKKDNFYQKQEQERLKMIELEAAKKKQLLARSKQLEQKERSRRRALEDSRRLEIEKGEAINRARIERERMVAQNAANRFSADMVAKTKEELRKKDKADNIERMRRIDEFVRLQTLQKIALDEERTQALNKQKEQLMLQRRIQASKQRVTKARLSNAIEGLRKSQKWDKLDSIIDRAVEGSDKPKKRKKKKKNSQSMPNLYGQP